MKYLKNICFYIVLALVLNIISVSIKSDFLERFLFNNIVVILITLMAINTATTSLIISKLEDISEKKKIDFKKTYNEMKLSLVEQIVLIIVAIILSMLNDSKVIKNLNYHQFVFNTLMTFIFIFAIDILRDTGIAIFKITEIKQKIKNKDSEG